MLPLFSHSIPYSDGKIFSCQSSDETTEAQDYMKDGLHLDSILEDEDKFRILMEKTNGEVRGMKKDDDKPPKDTYNMTNKEHKDLVSLNTNAKPLTLQKLCGTTVVQKGCYYTADMKLDGEVLIKTKIDKQKPNYKRKLER